MTRLNFNIDSKSVFDLPKNNDNKTCENVGRTAIGQGDDYRTSYLLDYLSFKENYKMIAIGLSKQQQVIQRINLLRI